MRNKDKQNRLKASVLALAIAAMPLGAHAAGLGKLTVVSALGQPLRAEIEVVASQEEYSSLSARLASPDAFKNAGIEYSSVLTGIRFTLERRADGRPFLKVSSDRPLNEPFVDMLVEANWASGRLVREYTFLLDPPDVFRKPPAPTPIAAPEVKPAPAPAPVVQAPKPPEAPRAAAPIEAKPEPKPAEPKPAAQSGEKPAAKPVEATREVKKGDTLGRIASETKPEGVNLDQMLVALFRSNQDAFVGGNMNRLRAGKILNIPDREAVAAVEGKEARSVVVAQAADFNAYRQKLASAAAAAPARDEAPKQLATGKITPRVEDKVPAPPAGSDKLEVSRSQGGGKPGASGKDRVAAVEEDLIAREKALREANTRIAQLEKNLNDLKRLAELRSAGGAKLQEQAKAAPATTPAEPPKPAEAAKPVEAPKTDVAPPVPPVTAPKPAPKPLTPPPPPPSFVEDNPELIFGGAGIVALLLSYLGYNALRRKHRAADDLPGPTTTGEAAGSVFGTTGGQTVDTGEDILPTDFSQDAAADLAGDEGVDPVAEADVYIAYGRDTQAEEILLEAMKKEPARAAIHLKLLEIYAARKSLPQFQAIARDLNALTAGMGADWEKAATLGRSIDPNNPLYGGVAAVAPAEETVEEAAEEAAADETQIISSEAVAAAEEVPAPAEEVLVTEEAPVAVEEAPAPEEIPPSLDFDLDLGEAPAAPASEAQPAAEAPADEAMSLDFDLDLGAAPAEQAAPAAESASTAEAEPEGAAALDFDLDLGAEPAEPAPAIEVPAEPAADANNVDFDLDLGSLPETPVAEAPAGVAPEHAGNTMDFDLDLPPLETPAEEAAAGLQVPAVETGVEPALDFDLGAEPAAEAAPELPPVEEPAAEAPPPALDLSSIDLELGEPEAAPVAEAPAEELALPETTQIVEDNPEVATKLELAQAYEEMGDKEGARELLNEVVAEGSPSQQQFARDRLAQLG